jgi:uncharacterized membrane protein YkoI
MREIPAPFRLYSEQGRQGSTMRFVLFFVVALGLVSAARGQSAAPLQDCVPQQEMQDVVASQQVVAPAKAVNAARQQVPNAEVVRASLCHRDNALVYVIVALRNDGRVVQVMIDGPSGRVKSVQ